MAMFVSDFRREFYELVQSQVTPSAGLWSHPDLRGGIWASGGGWVGRAGAPGLSPPALSPAEGPALRGLGRGRSVRLQDPSGDCGPWEGGPARNPQEVEAEVAGRGRGRGHSRVTCLHGVGVQKGSGKGRGE